MPPRALLRPALLLSQPVRRRAGPSTQRGLKGVACSCRDNPVECKLPLCLLSTCILAAAWALSCCRAARQAQMQLLDTSLDTVLSMLSSRHSPMTTVERGAQAAECTMAVQHQEMAETVPSQCWAVSSPGGGAWSQAPAAGSAAAPGWGTLVGHRPLAGLQWP